MGGALGTVADVLVPGHALRHLSSVSSSGQHGSSGDTAALVAQLSADNRRMYEEYFKQHTDAQARADERNANLMKELILLSSKAQTAKQVSMKDYARTVRENHNDFIQLVKRMEKVKTPTPSIAFVGRTNAGKSSMINALFKDELAKLCATGATRTTNDIKLVADVGDYHVYDAFGFNDGEMYEEAQQITKITSLHAVVLLYSEDLLSHQNVIELFCSADVKVIVLRSKFDKLDPEEIPEIEEVDKQQAMDFGAFCWGFATTRESATTRQDAKLCEVKSKVMAAVLSGSGGP
jgi:GTP-binding protein EngB required for normal cell division